jgi:hypothetical protein
MQSNTALEFKMVASQLAESRRQKKRLESAAAKSALNRSGNMGQSTMLTTATHGFNQGVQDNNNNGEVVNPYLEVQNESSTRYPSRSTNRVRASRMHAAWNEHPKNATLQEKQLMSSTSFLQTLRGQSQLR